jgi:hypothetical protein
MNTTTWKMACAVKSSATLAGLLVVWGCSPPVADQPTYQPTKADLEHAAHHEFDGRYVGTGNVAPGASCRQLVGNWGAMMTVSGSTFVLTPYFDNGQNRLYYGNVSPGGVLTNRRNVFVGRVTDGRFVGEYQLSASCRGSYVMERQATG